MYASTVGGGAMTIVFKPEETEQREGTMTAIKVPVPINRKGS